MKSNRKLCWLSLFVSLLLGLLLDLPVSAQNRTLETGQEKTIGISVNPADGTYTILDPVSKTPVLHSHVAAEIDHRWLSSSDYPQHSASRESDPEGNSLTRSNT